MTCRYISEPTPEKPDAEVGCVVARKDNKRKIKLASMSERWRWRTYTPPEELANVSIGVTDLKDTDPTWHALIVFKGNNH